MSTIYLVHADISVKYDSASMYPSIENESYYAYNRNDIKDFLKRFFNKRTFRNMMKDLGIKYYNANIDNEIDEIFSAYYFITAIPDKKAVKQIDTIEEAMNIFKSAHDANLKGKEFEDEIISHLVELVEWYDWKGNMKDCYMLFPSSDYRYCFEPRRKVLRVNLEIKDNKNTWIIKE